MYWVDFDTNIKGQFGKLGVSDGDFREPSGITVDGSGHLLIADSKNNRVQVGDTPGEILWRYCIN